MTSVFDYSAFQSKYKYRIAGEYDSLLARVGGLIKDDDRGYSFLKSIRQREAVRLQEIAATEPDPAVAQSLSAKSRLDFLEKSVRVANDAHLFRESKGVSAKSIALSLSGISAELEDVVEDYTTNTTDTEVDQDAFLARVQAVADRLSTLVTKTKGSLRAEGQHFNINVVRASRMLRDIDTHITNFLAARAGGASAMTVPVAEGSGSGATLDITV